jgi:hypothetical protein
MAASPQTIRDALDVLKLNAGARTTRRIVNDLKRVNGNKSFMDTVQALDQELKRDEAEGHV